MAQKSTGLQVLTTILNFVSQPHIWFTIVLIIVLVFGLLNLKEVLAIVKAVGEFFPDIEF